MRIESIYFGGENYVRMARVLAHTADKHCPGWEIHIRQIDPDPMKSYSDADISHITNSQKLEAWNDIVQSADDNDQILLIDADTFIVGSLDSVWDTPFDLAYTNKPGSRFPFNCGVMFVRASDRSKRFFRVWTEENRRMLACREAHSRYRKKYGGINQAAWGLMLESEAKNGGSVSLDIAQHGAIDQAAFGRILASDEPNRIKIAELHCRIWNCEDSHWEEFDPNLTKIVHVKGKLRRALFRPDRKRRQWYQPRPRIRNSERNGTQAVKRLVEIWKQLEHEALTMSP